MNQTRRKRGCRGPLRRMFCLAITLMLFLMTGCGLIPKEEELPAAPMLEEADTEEYILTPVVRGDLIVTQTIRASYIPSASEKLAFTIGGEYIGHVYVSLGDEVKAGDVLMELDLTQIESQIEAQQTQIDSLYLQLSQLYEQEALALEEARILDRQAADNKTPGWTSRESGVYATYGQQIQAINNTITIAEARLSELKEDEDALDTFNLSRMDADDDRQRRYADEDELADAGFDLVDDEEVDASFADDYDEE